MGVEIKLDMQAIKALSSAIAPAAEETMNDLQTNLSDSATMPFDTGDMQNNQTFVTGTADGATLVTGSPQARRLYYHPEYNFQRGKNENAGAGWLEPYISGDKKDFVQKKFSENFKRRTGV